MTSLQALLLGILQGLTEFLPVSSSGHLVLAQHLLGIELDQSVLLHVDVVLHAGTLLAILLYFRETWMRILRAPMQKEANGGPALLPLLIVGTVPVGAFGLLASDWIETVARTPEFVAIGFLLTGLLLFIVSYVMKQQQGSQALTWARLIIMSVGQAVGVLPGFSRSGWTLSGGVIAGLSAVRATEVAFLLGAPALGGALFHTLISGGASLSAIPLSALMIGFCASFVSSLLCMHLFLACIKKYGVWMWGVYLLIVGFVLL